MPHTSPNLVHHDGHHHGHHGHHHDGHHAAATSVDRDQLTVDTVDPALIAAEHRHELPRALRAGTPAMQEAAIDHSKWMWPLNGELTIVPLAANDPSAGGKHVHGENTVFDLRVRNSVLPDAWMSTIEQAAALPFANRIQLTGFDVELAGEDVTDASGQMVKRTPGWVDNIDGEGQTFDQWAAGAYLESMVNGVAFGFTDMDSRSFNLVAARKAAGGRPYLTLIKRSDLVWMVLEQTPAGKRLAAVAFRQPITKHDFSNPNDRKNKTTPAIKVVIAGRVDEDGTIVPVTTQLWVEDSEGDFIQDATKDGKITPPLQADAKDFLDIPLRPLYGRRTGPWTGESPYIRTADLAAELWRLSSQASQAAMELSLAYLFETGVPPIAKETGGENAVPINPESTTARYRSSTFENAKLTWAQQNPEAVEALDRRVATKTSELEKAHRALDSDRTAGPVTAREINVQEVHSSGELENRVIWHEAGWNQILTDFAILGGHSLRGRVSISHDFGLPAEDFESLWDGYKLGVVQAANVFEEARRHNRIAPSFDIKLEIAAEKERNKRLDTPEPPETASRDLLGALESIPPETAEAEEEPS